jgi:hypothetical protein
VIPEIQRPKSTASRFQLDELSTSYSGQHLPATRQATHTVCQLEGHRLPRFPMALPHVRNQLVNFFEHRLTLFLQKDHGTS